MSIEGERSAAGAGSGAARTHADDVPGHYERHARSFAEARAGAGAGEFRERTWLDRFLAFVKPGGTVLDIGCGVGEPMARHLLEGGFRVVGVDASPSMIEMCRARLPEGEWVVSDMRKLALGRRFDGILAWDSFFHLTMDEQRAILPRFAAHALPAAPLLFTSGPAEGESMGFQFGEPLYHASLSPHEYRRRLDESGFGVEAHVAQDPECGRHTVWLAVLEADGAWRTGPPSRRAGRTVSRREHESEEES